MNVADLCRYRMPYEDGFRQRAVTHNFCCARRRSVMIQLFPDRVGLQHERTAIVYIYHPLIAGCGDDDDTLLPVLPVKRRLTDDRKKKRLSVLVINEVGLLSGTAFFSLKPARCRHNGPPVFPQGLNHTPCRALMSGGLSHHSGP